MAMIFGQEVPTKTISEVKRREDLEKVKHVPGKIYTIVNEVKPKQAKASVKREEFLKMVKDLQEKYKGKAKLLFVKLDGAKRQLIIQYAPITSFFVFTIPLVLAMIFTIVVAAIAVMIIFTILKVGTEVVPVAAKALSIAVPALLLVGAAAVGYLIIKKPERVIEAAREAERRAREAARLAIPAARMVMKV